MNIERGGEGAGESVVVEVEVLQHVQALAELRGEAARERIAAHVEGGERGQPCELRR